ncbi:rhomboid family intramembrane serine protease [Halobacteriaceae archaeon SHR40]|uniref:rhomboid family intramembrane serine protease n=1 Tax=Halovenus amylolytica TaxID=2500550 RepID=UPI000FE2B1E6
MALRQASRTEAPGFGSDLGQNVRRLDLLMIATVPLVLLAVFVLPVATLERFVFDTTDPTLLTGYTAYFVHLEWFHLLGNLAVYLPAVGVAYLLCILSGRRRLFRITFVTVLVAFPLVLSAMQLIFPRERFIFGFSGLNAAFVGLASFALMAYLASNISDRADERHAPVFLFFVVGLVALLSLPARAYRFEIGSAALALVGLYLGTILYRRGRPTLAEFRAATDRPGYFELAGSGFGLLVGYPVVAFQDAVVPQGGVVDVYVHLLGFSLAFIVVFTFVFLAEEL